MITVMHKSGATLTDDSEIVLDILVTELKDFATFIKIGLSALGLIAINFV